MKKAVILCNGVSSEITDRVDLVKDLHELNVQPYCGRIFDGKVNEYFSDETAICVPIVASRNNVNPFVELRSMESVRKIIKRNDIDAAIVYGVKNHAAMAIGAKLGGARKVLCVVNGSGNLFLIKGFKGKILRAVSFFMLRIAYAVSDAIGFQNADDRKLFIEKRLIKDSPKSFVTGGSGVNLEVFSEEELPRENRFLFLSRITPSKGMIEYIKAAEIVKKKYPEAIFDIVGPLDSVVENSSGSLLQDAINADIIKYHGATDDVHSWMAKCRFFVYPSYHEGISRCTMQAMATGRPVITTNAPGCKETVVDGVNGFLVPVKDEETLAEKMIWMIEHPEETELMAVASRKIAEEKFDVKQVNKELISRLC
ncbi:MAG: glycosyltransferase family 4 protein [Ruminococcaceae bacterium]|nr:glycosyltransferase family 4 protein [Oscillospiraceae bacterium]